MLVGDDRVARFRAGVDAVEQFRLLVEVIAESLKMLIPVGEFDDEFDLGIDGACAGLMIRFSAASSINSSRNCVQLFVAFGGDVGIGLRGDEKEIVLDHLVEMPRRQFRRVAG